MKIKWSIITLLFGLLLGWKSEAKEIVDKRVVHTAMKLTADKVTEKYDLSFAGISEEGNKDNNKKYEVLGLFFNSKKYISKAEARDLVINITNIFLENLNNEQVRPWLSVFPFTEKNFEMTIYIKIPQRNWDYSQISFFGIRQGNIFYTYDIPNQPYRPRSEKETYAEAKKILDQESKTNFQTPNEVQ